jgi:hypothetical protein
MRTSAHKVRWDAHSVADSMTPSHSGLVLRRNPSRAKRDNESSTAFVRSRHYNGGRRARSAGRSHSCHEKSEKKKYICHDKGVSMDRKLAKMRSETGYAPLQFVRKTPFWDMIWVASPL